MSDFYTDDGNAGVLKKLNLFRRIYLWFDTGNWPPRWARYYTDVIGGNFGLLYSMNQETGDIKQIFFNNGENHYVARFEYEGGNFKIYDLSTGIEVEEPLNSGLRQVLLNFEITH